MTSVLLLLLAALAAPPVMSENMTVYAAAVAKTPLTAIAADYEKATGNKVTLVFDTAGAAAQKFQADPQASLLITSATLIRNAETSGALREGTTTPLGRTVAGVTVPPGTAKPDVSSPEKLKAALLAARRIAVSDPARGATVGNHFMKVIEGLGIKDQVLPKIALSNDGVETVHLVLEGKADIGVSQSSEILQSNPQGFAGPFPDAFALTTEFLLWHRDAVSPAVKDFVARITAPAGREKFAEGGVLSSAAR